MADKKISQLTAVTTPLAGTEELPAVQSSATKKVTVAQLQAAPVAAGVANAVQYLNESKAPSTSANFTYDGSVVNVQGALISISGATSGSGTLKLGDPSDPTPYVGVYRATAATIATAGNVLNLGGYDGIAFTAAPTALSAQTQRAFISPSTGNFTLNTGNLVIGTSGKGIDFSATAGTGTSELLADYEEGTWSPAITGAVSAGTGTYTAQNGKYTKIGNRVFITAEITWTNHTGTGDMLVTGLPYGISDVSSPSIAAIPNGVTLTASNILGGICTNTTSYIYLFQTPAGGGAWSGVPMDTSATIHISANYTV